MEATKTSKWKFLKLADFFPKMKDDIKIQTTFSGGISIICSLIITFLFVYECYFFFRTDVISQVSVDLSYGNNLKINIDFTLPGLPCDEFGLDLVDSAGDMQLNILDQLNKIHTTKGRETDLKARGCNIYGTLTTHKVKGEFHIAFGKQAEAMNNVDGSPSNNHLHRFQLSELFTFNASHVINHLSFGEDFPGVIQPLDGTKKIVTKGSGRYLYYLQIVPTVYKYQNGKEVHTNQYSYSEHDVIIDPTARTFKQPGIYFKYEMSPYTVTYTEKNKYLFHFLTNVCAIIGGVYVVFGMVSSSKWYMDRVVLKKPVK